MKPNKRRKIIATLLSAMTACLVLAHRPSKVEAAAAPQKGWKAVVTRVIDGDTLDVEFTGDSGPYGKSERLRLCGIDTPELNLHKDAPPESGAEAARDILRSWLLNTEVTVEPDSVSSFRDRYGRAVAYVWSKDVLVNAWLVGEGYARYYNKYKFDPDKMRYFQILQYGAQRRGDGIWKKKTWIQQAAGL